MNKEITIVFVSYYSKKNILKYLNQFKDNFKVIVIENSNDSSLKKNLKKFKNVSIHYNKKNIGFGASSNKGLKKITTKYGLHLDLDTKFSNDSILKLINQANNLDDFIILGPKIKKYNYKARDYKKKNILKNLNSMNFIDGCCMLFNMNKLKKFGYFDENFFLYFEEYDLFKRYLKKNQKIIMTDNISIYHKGRSSSDTKCNNEIEINRNWHYMWSKFYFYKKHNNFFYAFTKVIRSLFSSAIKTVFYSFSGNNFKKEIYFARFDGVVNSILNRKSWYRPKI